MLKQKKRDLKFRTVITRPLLMKRRNVNNMRLLSWEYVSNLIKSDIFDLAWTSQVCCCSIMADFSRFAASWGEQKESERCLKALPKKTPDKTRWGTSIFMKWAYERASKDPALESGVKAHGDISAVQSLETPSKEIKPISLNLWPCKFMREVRNKNGKRYV